MSSNVEVAIRIEPTRRGANRWSQAEDDYVLTHYRADDGRMAKERAGDIARHLGRSRAAVVSRAFQVGAVHSHAERRRGTAALCAVHAIDGLSRWLLSPGFEVACVLSTLSHVAITWPRYSRVDLRQVVPDGVATITVDGARLHVCRPRKAYRYKRGVTLYGVQTTFAAPDAVIAVATPEGLRLIFFPPHPPMIYVRSDGKLPTKARYRWAWWKHDPSKVLEGPGWINA